jgi:hypothetical protein
MMMISMHYLVEIVGDDGRTDWKLIEEKAILWHKRHKIFERPFPCLRQHGDRPCDERHEALSIAPQSRPWNVCNRTYAGRYSKTNGSPKAS